jgi:hypothetical protein
MLLRIAIIVYSEKPPEAPQEKPGERHWQPWVFLFAKSEGGPKVHEPARRRLHVDEHMRTVRLIFGLAPFVRVRRKGHGKLEGSIDGRLSVVLHKPVERPAQELRGFPATCGPIGRTADAEFDQNGGESRCGCIASV